MVKFSNLICLFGVNFCQFGLIINNYRFYLNGNLNYYLLHSTDRLECFWSKPYFFILWQNTFGIAKTVWIGICIYSLNRNTPLFSDFIEWNPIIILFISMDW